MSAAVLPCVCAWCERWRTQSGEWREAEPAEAAAPEVTHGICPDCLEEETGALAHRDSHP